MAKKARSITFLLPFITDMPVGGYATVYEYANRLATRGYRITLIHAYTLYRKKKGIIGFIRLHAGFLRRLFLIAIGRAPWRWFPIHSAVRMRIAETLNEFWIPDADSIIATFWKTAEYAARYSRRKGAKFYFIQGMETDIDPSNASSVIKTWHMPLGKFAASKWLVQQIEATGQQCAYLPNGVDSRTFHISIPVENRFAHCVCMMISDQPVKGSADGLEALRIVYKKIPDVSASLYGTQVCPSDLESWMSYSRLPSLEKLVSIYNRSAVFVSSSLSEGFGLPACEAAACGAALCLTAYGGHSEYAIHEETALVSEPGRPEALAANIIRLMTDEALRVRLASCARRIIEGFSWEKSTGLLIKHLNTLSPQQDDEGHGR
jgi:glycosyltransferase involved in cell wall biosynthesis